MNSKSNFNKFLWILVLFTLAACAPTLGAAQAPAATQVLTSLPLPSSTPAATSTPAPTVTPQPTAAKLSFTPATYQDKEAGFEIDYPSSWTLVPKSVIGSRGAQAGLFSPGSTTERVVQGGSRLGLTVYKWDPQKDLSAFAAHRTSAWEGSSFTVTPGAAWALSDGRRAASFVVVTPDKLQTYFLLTTVGEGYLEISGEGDLALVQEIAHTLRPAAVTP